MKILIIKSLFVPNHRFIKANTNSIDKFIEYIMNAKLADVIDLVVDRDLYDYHKIINGKRYATQKLIDLMKKKDKNDH